jgi:ABC-type branched-subunit amino acid transport system substrate-binding protein
MQNLTIAMQWAATAQAVEQEAFFKEYAAARKAGKPETASMHTLAAYKSLRIIASAAARVVSTGKAAPDAPTDFRAALREELRAYQEISPFWGEINFAAGGQSPGEVVLVQVIDGRPVIVYPPDRIE